MTPQFSLIIASRDRAETLTENLRRLSALGDGVEVIVVDNASSDGTAQRVRRDFPRVQVIELETNLAAAARNVGARAARAPILLLLDDDSDPEPAALPRLGAVMSAPDGPAIVAARVVRTDPPGTHEGGGLPGVFIGCGAAVRRDLFLELGGYPEDYGYYVEEYAFCIRALRAGHRVRWYDDIVVTHRRSGANRDFNHTVRFLTRNNVRLWHRFAPPDLRDALLVETLERYARMAANEHAEVGYVQGLAEAAPLLGEATPSPEALSPEHFRLLYGLDVAEKYLTCALAQHRPRRVAVWGRGKGVEQLLGLLSALGRDDVTIFDDRGVTTGEWRGRTMQLSAALQAGDVDLIVVGSLSPGACRDLAGQARAAAPATPVIECVQWLHSHGHANAGR